jgi:microcystin-dependent protein
VASQGDGLERNPPGQLLATGIGISEFNDAAGNPLVPTAPEALAPAGGDQPHNNLQPYLTFYFCIALQGVYPPRT